MRKINALWGLLLTASTMAADMDSGTLGQLEVIQQQNILLTSKAETARLQKQIRDSESDGVGNSGSGADNLPAVSMLSPATNGLPTTDSIVGRNGTLMATLRLTNGARVDVKEGEKITGTPWSVARITLNGVLINNGHSVTGLAFSE